MCKGTSVSALVLLCLTAGWGNVLCQTDQFPIELAQGVMAGEVDVDSAILQSRLTSTNSHVDPRWSGVIGAPGVACFELATNPVYRDSFRTKWLAAVPEYDFIVKTKVKGLRPGTRYYYRLVYGVDRNSLRKSQTCTFRTHSGRNVADRVSLAIITCMHYSAFHAMGRYYWGPYVPPYAGKDKDLGYPALEAIMKLKPDLFIGTGDNVYLDEPPEGRAETQQQIRKKYQEQFSQPRLISLFAQVPTYWEKDDHDFRFNDSDPINPYLPWQKVSEEDYSQHLPDPRISGSGELPTHTTAVRLFREQLPVTDPEDQNPVTYRTLRVNKLVQIWLVEGRDYRSRNDLPDGPEKTIWGKAQKEWLKRTLLESDASFKLLISPTPLVGPDSRTKRDNHVNPRGFRYEGEEFLGWLSDHRFPQKGLCIINGDRHWKYHSIHPSGVEEFSCGALDITNSVLGFRPGDPDSSDPEGRIKQPYLNARPTGGFLMVTAQPEENSKATLTLTFYDEKGSCLYRHKKAPTVN